MSDTRFERERPALEQQPLPVRSRVQVIGTARHFIETLAPRIEQPTVAKQPTMVPLDLVAQVQADGVESIPVLTNMAAEKAAAKDDTVTDSEQSVVNELDLNEIRRQVEVA